MPGGTRGYNVWTPDEEDALRRGVKKHGLGAWEVIRKDPEFSVLENRTGVQLKDKFRNLVKFRHISQEESRSLKPKGSGPWSRKHSASSFINERSITRTPSANEIPGANLAEEHDNTAEHAAALLALEAGKAVPDADTTVADAGANGLKGLPRPRGRSMGGFETCSDDEAGGGGPEAAARRKRRRSLENRSFGIYDQRRYRSDGTLRTPGDDERTATESDGDEPSRPARQRRSNSGGRGGRVPRGRTRGRRRVDDDSEETTTEEEDFPSEDERADEADVQPEDDYVVDCPCGIRYDDGAMMVECEACKTWAHIDCLQYQATNNPTVVYDLNNYTCLQCQNKRNPLLAGGLVKTAKASNGPGKGRMPNGADLMMNADAVVEHLGGLTSRYSRDRTQEAGHVLLGLANGDMRMPDGGPGLPRTGSKQSLRGGALPGMPTLPPGLSSGILTAGALQTPAYLDSLSLFLAATARPNSALGGHPAGSPTSPSKMTTGSGRGAIAVPRAERLASGPLTTAADRSASQQNLDKLLAAANIPLDSSSNAGAGAGASGDGGLGAGGASALRQPSLLADGGAGSPNGLSALRQAGSSSAAGHLSSVAALSSLARPASRGPTGQELFGDSDDDLHHSAALAQLFNTQTSNDRLLQMLASNRVATPSQMFLEQLMRGATPDINLAPLIQGAALQGAAAAAAAAAAASHQLQILHQHGLTGAHSLLQPDTSGMLPAGLAQALQMQAMMAAQGLGVPPTGPAPGTGGTSTGGNADKAVDKARPGGLNPDDLVQLAAAVSVQNSLGMHAMELRPGTPDTWALLRGSTPTPDAMGLHSFGIPPLAGFPTDPTWLLQRGSPALVNHADAQQLPAIQAQIAAASQQGAGGTQPAIKKEPAPAANGSGSVAGQASKDDQQQQAQPVPPAPEKVNEETKSAVAAPAQQPPVPTFSGSTPVAAHAAVAPAAAAAPAVESAAPAPAVKTEQGAAAAATAMAEAAASSAAAAAARSLPASSSAVAAAVLGGPSVAAVMELVDRKSSLGVLGSAGDLAAAVAACAGGSEEAYFNVEDMLRSSTPALR